MKRKVRRIVHTERGLVVDQQEVVPWLGSKAVVVVAEAVEWPIAKTGLWSSLKRTASPDKVSLRVRSMLLQLRVEYSQNEVR